MVKFNNDYKYLFYVLAFLLSFQEGRSSYIITPTLGHVDTPPTRDGLQDFNITSEVVWIDHSFCEEYTTSNNNITGKIFYILEGHCSAQQKAHYAELSGASGVIVGRDGIVGAVGYLVWIHDPKWAGKYNIPCVEFSKPDNEKWLDIVKSNNMTIILTPDSNQYKTVPLIIFQAVMLPISLIILLIASYKLFFLLYSRLKVGGNIKTSPLFVLSFELCSNLLRVLWCIDPFYKDQRYNRMANELLYSVNIPFTLSACFFIAYYWQKTLKVYQFPNLVHAMKSKKVKIPVVVFLISLFIFELATDIWRGTWKGDSLLIWINSGLYVIFAIGTSIFYLVTGIRVVLLITRSGIESRSTKSKHKNIRLKIMTGLIIMSSVGIVLFFIALIIIPQIADDTKGIYDFVIWICIYISIDIVSLVNVIIIRSRPTQTTSSVHDISMKNTQKKYNEMATVATNNVEPFSQSMSHSTAA